MRDGPKRQLRAVPATKCPPIQANEQERTSVVTYINLRRALPAVFGLTLVGLAAGCTGAPVSPGELGQLQTLATSCPAHASEHHQTRIDVSGSGERAGLGGTTREVVASDITRTAVCGGGIYSLVIFSAGNADTVQVFHGSLTLPGATENARLRRLPAVRDKTLAAIDAAYPGAVSQLTNESTDVVAQLSGVGEFTRQVRAASPTGSSDVVAVTIRTDGIGTVGAGALPDPITVPQAVAVADQVAVPNLSTTDVLTFSGIGQVSDGDRPDSAYVDALKAFYQRVGERSGAKTVQVATEYVGGR